MDGNGIALAALCQVQVLRQVLGDKKPSLIPGSFIAANKAMECGSRGHFRFFNNPRNLVTGHTAVRLLFFLISALAS